MRDWWRRSKGRLTALFEEYGRIALITYLSIFGLTLLGFVTALEMGFQPESAAADTGTWVVAYGLTKVLQPVRIGATVVLTPVIATFLRRRSPTDQTSPAPDAGGTP